MLWTCTCISIGESVSWRSEDNTKCHLRLCNIFRIKNRGGGGRGWGGGLKRGDGLWTDDRVLSNFFVHCINDKIYHRSSCTAYSPFNVQKKINSLFCGLNEQTKCYQSSAWQSPITHFNNTTTSALCTNYNAARDEIHTPIQATLGTVSDTEEVKVISSDKMTISTDWYSRLDNFLVPMQCTWNSGCFPRGRKVSSHRTALPSFSSFCFPVCSVFVFPYHRLWGLLFYDRWIWDL